MTEHTPRNYRFRSWRDDVPGSGVTYYELTVRHPRRAELCTMHIAVPDLDLAFAREPRSVPQIENELWEKIATSDWFRGD